MSDTGPAKEAALADLIGALVDEVAGISIAPDAGFFAAGLTSQTLVAVHARMQERLAREIDLAMLFKYPSRTALARFLASACDPAIAPARPLAVPPFAAREMSPAARRELRTAIRRART